MRQGGPDMLGDGGGCFGGDSMGSNTPSPILLLLLWPGCVEVMAAAILWFIRCIEVVGVVTVFVWDMPPWSYPFMALVHEILVSIVL